ncbi:hypothetical protein WJ542_21245 [Paraburkholderia sp. B3]|uniref:hypothetical protein n=1 Tax=Paraburkholderia sp. B3 TaxID=3134791 RepID=UPI003981E2B4
MLQQQGLIGLRRKVPFGGAVTTPQLSASLGAASSQLIDKPAAATESAQQRIDV